MNPLERAITQPQQEPREELSFSSNQLSLDSDEGCEVEQSVILSGVHKRFGYNILVDHDDDHHHTENLSHNQNGKKARQTSSYCTESCKNKWDSMDNYFVVATKVMEDRLAKLNAESVEQYTIAECLEVLEKLGDVNGSTFNKFLDKIVPCRNWREAFLAMSDDRKRQWLEGL